MAGPPKEKVDAAEWKLYGWCVYCGARDTIPPKMHHTSCEIFKKWVYEEKQKEPHYYIE